MTSKRSTSTHEKWIDTPFFAPLAGILPLLILWGENRLQVAFRVVLPVFLLTVAGVLLVWLVCLLLFRSRVRGSYFSLLVFLLFFTFGHVYNQIGGTRVAGIEIGYLKLLVVYVVLLIFAGIFIILHKHPRTTMVSVLNIITIGLVIFNMGRILVFQVQRGGNSRVTGSEVVEKNPDQPGQPDVYYLILDAYARADFLMETYQYDNSSFIEALEERGFYVADCSNSNYDGTLSSVASSLNFDYLDLYDIPDDDLSGRTGKEVKQLANNRVMKELRPLGYQFVTTRGYSAFNDIRTSDLYLNVVDDPARQFTLQRSQFTRLFLSTTLLRVVFELYTANPSEYAFIPYWFELSSENEFLDSSTFWYNQTRYVLDQLETIPERKGNFFVYAHINAPHGPYVFDRDGNFRYIEPTDNRKEYYVDTIIYLNKRVLQLVDTLLSKSEQAPIIIIQGDHGSHIVAGGYDKHKILNAYFLPGSDFELYDTITPVNTFRIILNEYFGKQYELLPDNLFVKVTNKREIHPSQCTYP